jgi:ATP-binding cassette subfamily G (WHITE) protein 2 (SNQ2)
MSYIISRVVSDELTSLLSSFIFQAVITGSVFISVDDNTGDFYSRGGVIFLWVSSRILISIDVESIHQPRSALLFSTLSAQSEIPALYSQRPIVYRHEQSALYHPFIEAVALTLVDIPIALGTIIIFSAILYFMTGLQRSAVSLAIIFRAVDKSHLALLGSIFVRIASLLRILGANISLAFSFCSCLW